jgi:uncharacterized protein (TIGR02246 family)
MLVFACTALMFLFGGNDAPQGDVAAFNQRFDDAIRAMDNEAVIAMWADDGVDMMPGQAPLLGKPAIAKFIRGMGANLKGYKVLRHDTEYHVISQSGNTVAEWLTAKQTVAPPDGGKNLEASGRIILVLEKDASGWKIKSEMWQPAP